ncbi:uncharacterized protein [Diadema antillarum]|uniref:uncharacterized protein n=1 Tax=Diadema antillarum TaxID=105358 RepID=UPI003A868C7B
MSGWISFDEDGDASAPAAVASSNGPAATTTKAVNSGGAGHRQNNSQAWVKFEESSSTYTPTATGGGNEVGQHRPAVVPQHTGGSVYSSADVMSQASDDHFSAVASSVISSRGSFSESHENISSSREYMPLESSSPKPGTVTPIPEGWVKFTDSKSPVSSTPKKVTADRGPSHNGNFEDTGTPSPVNWVKFNEEKNNEVPSVNSIPSPTLPSVDKSKLAEVPMLEVFGTGSHSIGSKRTDVQGQEAAQKRSSPIRDVNRNISGNLQSSEEEGKGDGKHLSATPIHMTDRANDMEVSMLVAGVVRSGDVTPSSAGNPFKQEALKQEQQDGHSEFEVQARRTMSPFNPFLAEVSMSGDSASAKPNVSATWERFDETDSAQVDSQRASTSPGNPFAGMTVGANMHSDQSVGQPFTPRQGQESFVAAALAQQSMAASQPTRQVLAVQPLPQSLADQTVDQRTAALLSPDLFASQPISPSSMKPNQWPQPQQHQQHFFPPNTVTSQSSFPQSTHAVAAKQPVAAIVAPTTISPPASLDVPDFSKEPLKQRTSIKSNISSPSSDKAALFQDEYPRESVDLSEGWPLKLRCPDKKKIAGSRYWQPVHVRLSEGNILQLFNDRTRREPFRELPLQCSYELRFPSLQQFDVKGKIHTIKLMYTSYKERRSIGSGYSKEAKLEQLMKLGSLDFKVFRSFVYTISDALMKLTLFQDRGAHYQQDMISVVVGDDYRCLVNSDGEVTRQSITVNLNVLSFLSSSPDCAIGVNDVQVKGLDAVARQHLIPNKTSDWIRLHNVELHKCANKNVFADSRMIEFQPLNACQFRLMQFHVQPSEEQDLPLQAKAALSGEGTHLELRVDLLIPACTGKRDPTHFICEDVMVHVPIPDQWISYFRKPKRMGMSSIHAIKKRAEVIKRGCVNPALLEISVGTAKYEHAYRAVMWRIERLPERHTGHPATHLLKCHLNLTSIREVPENLVRPVEVEYTTPFTTASKTTVRSLAVCSERPIEKRICYRATYGYQVQIAGNYSRVSDSDLDGPNKCPQQ